MNRRGFLGSILALGAAPAIVRADGLMRMIPTNTGIVGFDFYESSACGELVDDLILDISPMETPFISSLNQQAAAVDEIRRTLMALGLWRGA